MGELRNSDWTGVSYGTFTEEQITVLRVPITADATGGMDIKCPFKCKILDVKVQCTAANVAGTVTLANAGNAVTSAIVCAVLDVISKTTKIDVTYEDVAKDATLTLTTNGAADRGVALIEVIRT
jgi:hypothetical protein